MEPLSMKSDIFLEISGWIPTAKFFSDVINLP